MYWPGSLTIRVAGSLACALEDDKRPALQRSDLSPFGTPVHLINLCPNCNQTKYQTFNAQ